MNSSPSPRRLAPGLPAGLTALHLSSVGDVLFKELEACVGATGPSTRAAEQRNELLASLSLVYGKNNCSKALDIVEKGGVTCWQAEGSGRRIFQVHAQSAAPPYLVFPTHYCTCQAFFYDVASKCEYICCKHQLAARFGVALSRCPIRVVSDVELAQFLVEGLRL